MATRSLGTLTLDLIAKIGGFEQGMDKAEKRTQKWRREVKRNVEAAGKAFAAGASVAAGALAIMTTRVINNAREIENFSQVANTGAEDFQRFAFAAERVGIEQDKLADILKDTSDRVGDFLQTGAGPMADFFENIAPQVGVTAEEFRNLSGADALGLYVSSLEKANLSQSEMTFYMEAIASDATLLLPLLRDNGRELDRFAKEAEDAGAVLSRLELDQLLDAKENIDELGNAFDGLKNDIVLGAVPVVKELTDLLSDDATIESAKSLANGIATAFLAATKAISGTIEVTKFLAEEAASITAGPSGDDIVRLEETRDLVTDLLNDASLLGKLDRVRFFGPKGIVEYYSEAELQEELKRLNQQIDTWYDNEANKPVVKVTAEVDDVSLPSLSGDLLPTDFSDPFADFNELAEDRISDLKAQAEELERQRDAQEAYNRLVEDLQTDEERLTQQVRDRLSVLDAIKDITDAQRNQALGRIADAATEDAPELGGVSSFEGIDTARMELKSWYDEQLDMLRDFRAERADLNATWDEEELALRQEYEDRLTEITQANEELRRQQMVDGYTAILDIAGKYYEGLESDEAAYARAAIQLGKTLLDEKKRNALTSILASTQAAAMGAYEALASIPYVGPFLGAAAAAGIYITGGIAAAEVSGLAHDGIDSVPEDGTWLLQRGERVTTAETSAKLDRTLDTIERGLDRRSSGSMGGVTQNIYVEGKPDRRTSTQIARDTERSQRMTAHRLGVGR